MPKPKLSVETLLARGTFDQRKQGDRIKYQRPEALRPPLPQRPKCEYVPDIPIDFDDLIEANYDKTVQDACADIPQTLTKAYARKWCWDESDEFAISNGCRFDLRRAMHFAYSLRNHLSLWEGRWSGEPFILRTWQPECLLRIYGWIRPDEELGWVRRYSKSAIWIPKKSGKSPTGAAVAIYSWRMDGIWKDEKGPTVGGGQHVYCIAKNGKQAGIVWGHARNMVHNSPQLKIEVQHNDIRTDHSRSLLTYYPKLSKLTTVTGDSPAARAAAEGLNAAAIICDEAHVVSNSTVQVTVDSGTSQDQFLWFQISTFGDSDGYGKQDLETGRDVASGKIKDDGFFFKSYQAPQDSSENDCGREEIWREANPNLGYTVSLRKFEESYQRSKDDPAAFSGFKQRRLNIWQRSSNPMFNYAAWLKCADESLRDKKVIRGVGGGAGIDLAAADDWAALALAWDDGDVLKLFVRMWCVEDWIFENDHRADFQQWVHQGHLQVHSGAAIDFERIQTEVIELLRAAKTGCLGFDYMFGAQMSQAVQRKLPRLAVHKFSQSVEGYAHATAELKNGVKNGTLRHPGSPPLDWQAGHVRSKVIGEYEKPIKDTEHLWQKIDGIQASCMAIRCRHEAPTAVKPYVGIV